MQLNSSGEQQWRRAAMAACSNGGKPSHVLVLFYLLASSSVCVCVSVRVCVRVWVFVALQL